MINAVMMPRIGLNETENMLGEVYVNEGDKVVDGDELFSVETDKSSLSVYAETSGTILKIFYESFEAVEVLTPVCVIGEPGKISQSLNQNLITMNLKTILREVLG